MICEQIISFIPSLNFPGLNAPTPPKRCLLLFIFSWEVDVLTRAPPHPPDSTHDAEKNEQDEAESQTRAVANSTRSYKSC